MGESPFYCATQGESFEELLTNLYEAVERIEVCDLNHYIRPIIRQEMNADERRNGNKTIRSSNEGL